jgi:hypothetical protein
MRDHRTPHLVLVADQRRELSADEAETARRIARAVAGGPAAEDAAGVLRELADAVDAPFLRALEQLPLGAPWRKPLLRFRAALRRAACYRTVG